MGFPLWKTCLFRLVLCSFARGTCLVHEMESLSYFFQLFSDLIPGHMEPSGHLPLCLNSLKEQGKYLPGLWAQTLLYPFLHGPDFFPCQFFPPVFCTGFFGFAVYYFVEPLLLFPFKVVPSLIGEYFGNHSGKLCLFRAESLHLFQKHHPQILFQIVAEPLDKPGRYEFLYQKPVTPAHFLYGRCLALLYFFNQFFIRYSVVHVETALSHRSHSHTYGPAAEFLNRCDASKPIRYLQHTEPVPFSLPDKNRHHRRKTKWGRAHSLPQKATTIRQPLPERNSHKQKKTEPNCAFRLF